MNEEIIRINEKVFIHLLVTDKFKSNVVAAFLLTDLSEKNVTKNALIPAVLRRGTSNLKTMKDISIKMEDMYGATFDASVDKIGDKQALQFYISTIDNKYALNGEDLLSDSLNFIYDIIYNPKTENGMFNAEYVEQEKETLRELINSKINNKASYAVFRAIEEMYQNDPYALFKYGNIKDLENITAKNLYEQYKNVLETSEEHFYIAGNFERESILNFFESKYEKGTYSNEKIQRTKKSELDKNEYRNVVDRMDVTQGKLVLGYEVGLDITPENFYKVLVFNAILGSSSNSKMFQNVREKASLAYTARSSYIKHKGVLLITAGIELDKYEQALELTKVQINDMKIGNFSDEDIKDAKVFLGNLFTSCLDDQTTMIELSIGQFVLGDEDSVPEMIENIKKVTREDIIEVANSLRLAIDYYLTK